MKSEAVANADDLPIRNPQVRSRAVIRSVAARNDRVQSIVAARELDHNENSLWMLLQARSLKRLRSECRRCPVQNERQPGADTDAVQASDEKVAAGTRA